MGKVMSRLNRQWYRINAENRAQRVISKEKPTPAPRHPSSLKGIEAIMSSPGYDKEKATMKDPVLDEYLKKVYITSKDPVVKERFKKPSEKRMMPLERTSSEELELGYVEPISVPKGKITLKQLMELLTLHLENPSVYNISRIAEQYRISTEDARNILEYLASFKVHYNDETPQPAKALRLTEFKKFLGKKSESV